MTKAPTAPAEVHVPCPAQGGSKILPVVPQLIIPIKKAGTAMRGTDHLSEMRCLPPVNLRKTSKLLWFLIHRKWIMGCALYFVLGFLTYFPLER